MTLCKKLDTKRTKQAAIKRLSNYRTVAKIAQTDYTSKVTATYSFEPRSFGGMVNKPLEDHVCRKDAAQRLLEDMSYAINMISKVEYRRILLEKYCNKYEVSDKVLYMEMEYSESEYYRKLEKALISFAESFRGGELLVFEDGTNVDDFIMELF